MIKDLFSKENLTAVAGLGVGATAAKVVEKKVLTKVIPASMAPYSDVIAGIAPIALGFFLPAYVKGNFGRGLGDGMIAAGAGKLVEKALTTAGQGDLINGVMMGEAPLMGEIDMNAGAPLMGATGVDNYSADSYDYTAASSGEMNF